MNFRQRGDRAGAIRGETDLRPRSRHAEDGDPIRRAHARADEGFGRAARDLLVARGNVLLIEDQHVEVPTRRAAVRGHFGGHRAHRRVGVRAGGLLDVLKEKERADLAVFDDLDFVGPEVDDRPAVRVGDAQVEAHQLDTGPEDRLLRSRQCRMLNAECRKSKNRGAPGH